MGRFPPKSAARSSLARSQRLLTSSCTQTFLSHGASPRAELVGMVGPCLNILGRRVRAQQATLLNLVESDRRWPVMSQWEHFATRESCHWASPSMSAGRAFGSVNAQSSCAASHSVFISAKCAGRATLSKLEELARRLQIATATLGYVR